MKILVLRFSSIGDIVLTSPVVRCLKQQVKGAEVHVATKRAFEKMAEVPYAVVDVSTNSAARDMLADMGYRAAPVVITAAGEHWSGFRPDRISALSALSAQAAVASNASRAAPALTPDRRAPAGPAPLDHAARAWAQAMAERMRTGLRSAANTGLSL